jgi:3-methyladenine DNA glycosylase/8-oxoguanine DNA glycosylase
MIDRRVALERPLSLRQTYGALRKGAFDPCVRFDTSGFWRASRTPSGSVTTLLQIEGEREVRVRAWGDGSEWFDAHLADFLGDHCDDAAIDDPQIAALAHEFPGMRIPRVHSLTELAIPIVLEQRVTTREAYSAYSRIVRSFRDVAPGPNGAKLLLPPDPRRLADMPPWWFHRFGVERKRAQTVREVCRRSSSIDALPALDNQSARTRLLSIPGVGMWTAAYVAMYGLGDHDAVITGDFHFPNHIAYALAGEARADDARMLTLLEPFRGQRGRVMRLILMGGASAPKFGPRYSPLPIASI